MTSAIFKNPHFAAFVELPRSRLEAHGYTITLKQDPTRCRLRISPG